MTSPEIGTQYVSRKSPDVFAESIAMLYESAGCVASVVNLVGALAGEGIFWTQARQNQGQAANLLQAPTYGSQIANLSFGLGLERR